MTANWGLTFGSVNLSPWAQVGDVEICVYGLTRGTPAPITSTIDSLLQDGALERIDRYDNRDQQVIVGLKAGDAQALAEAEAALFLECQKDRNELAWTPPDGFGPTTVFDVLWANLEPSESGDWDLDELRGFRTYVLTLRCLPFGRSVAEVVDAALPPAGATPTTVVMADGTSTAGWSSSYSISLDSGALLLGGSGAQTTTTDANGQSSSTYDIDATFTFATVDFTATPYVSFTLTRKYVWQGVPTFARVAVDGGPDLPIVAKQPVADGTRFTVLCTDGSATKLRIRATATANYASTSPTPTVAMRLDDLTRSNQPPNGGASSTGQQAVRTVQVKGSARTEASLSVSHATAGLGDVFVYSCPELGASYAPDLSRWNTDARTVDASTITGSYLPINSSTTRTFQVPAASLPRGGYVMMARARADGSTSLTRRFSWTASTKVGSGTFGTQSGKTASQTLDATWRNFVIGGMVLPPTDVPATSAATVRVTLTLEDISTVGNARLDEVWLFYCGEDAALSVVSCGAGTPAVGSVHNRLWLDTATVDHPSPAVWRGTQADRSDAFHAGEAASSWGVHRFAPGAMNVFVVTSAATNPAVELRHFPRWLTHAAA